MKTILIVDDDDLLREMLGEVLRMEGYDVTEATDGKTALKLAKKKTFDVVTLDVALEKEDGRALVDPIRELQPKAKIYLLTGMDEPELKSKAKHHADGHFSKAQPMEKLLAKIASGGAK
ncbi:MAG TPA: response regulator [Verrucomicrobiae bacterium]